MIMKYYLVLCYKDRLDQTPAKRMVLHKDCLTGFSSLLEEYVYVVVEPLNPVVLS